MLQTSDLSEKSVLIFLYNFHRDHKLLKLKLTVIAENQFEKHNKLAPYVMLRYISLVDTLQDHILKYPGPGEWHGEKKSAKRPPPTHTHLNTHEPPFPEILDPPLYVHR